MKKFHKYFRCFSLLLLIIIFMVGCNSHKNNSNNRTDSSKNSKSKVEVEKTLENNSKDQGDEENIEDENAIKLLSIGNSFSQDAHFWLHQISKSYGKTIKAYNLFIGGAPLELHASNIAKNKADYTLEINGMPEKKISIEDALKLEDKFDIVTVQQVSQLTGMLDSYEPYLSEVLAKVKALQPEARLLFHQTWAYDDDSNHGGFANYDNNRDKMWNAIKDTTEMIAKENNLALIKVGEVIENLRHSKYFGTSKHAESTYSPYGHQKIKYNEYDMDPNTLPSLTRDAFHLNLWYGRYAAALTWYATITGDKVSDSDYKPKEPAKYPANQELSDEEWKFIRNTVDNVVFGN